jgi:hypothetical protein
MEQGTMTQQDDICKYISVLKYNIILVVIHLQAVKVN